MCKSLGERSNDRDDCMTDISLFRNREIILLGFIRMNCWGVIKRKQADANHSGDRRASSLGNRT